MKKKKTLLYAVFAGVLVYLFAQMNYFNQTYSPLQVLSDARSEAKRLLRFITLYHFQCNSTLQLVNSSYWTICVESSGINLETKPRKIGYSIGPRGDFEFEKSLVKNLSFSMYNFGPDLGQDSPLLFNNSKVVRKSLVPNDPADFVRNSYETQTINNVLLTLGHRYIDVLKIDHFVDSSDAHEFLYFMIKDSLLTRVGQLHLTIHIDKVDDDYLYNWYRALYKLFQEAGFRLYHTSANDQLCIQVTLMESCVYYLSWVKDPGPNHFVLYPPAQDGSEESEEKRLVDYLSVEEAICADAVEIELSDNQPLSVCLNEDYLHKPCNIIIIRDKKSDLTVKGLSKGQCHAVVLETTSLENDGSIQEYVVDVKGSLLRTSTKYTSLMNSLDQHLHDRSSNMVYFDLPDIFWDVLTPLLNSGHLQRINQLIADIDLWNGMTSLYQIGLRKRFSELKRIAAYGFQIYESNNLNDLTTIHFHSHLKRNQKCCHRVSYLRTKHVVVQK